jgi:hypothetical protein
VLRRMRSGFRSALVLQVLANDIGSRLKSKGFYLKTKLARTGKRVYLYCLQIMISRSPDDLVDCTAAVSARYRLGIRPHTSLVAAICNKAGVNLEDITLSRATVHRKRF